MSAAAVTKTSRAWRVENQMYVRPAEYAEATRVLTYVSKITKRDAGYQVTIRHILRRTSELMAAGRESSIWAIPK